MLSVIEGGHSDASLDWDASLEEALADAIETYIAASPPPAGSAVLVAARQHASDLRASAKARRDLMHSGAPVDEDEEDAATEAWLRVAAGFEAAVRVPGLSPKDRAAHANRLRLARKCAGLSPAALTPVGGAA